MAWSVVRALVLVCWLRWNHLPLWGSCLLVGVLTLLTLGTMRLVAEAGIVFLFLHTGFFHVYKVFGLGKLLSPLLVTAMLPICSVFFMHYATFIAPNILNATRARQEVASTRFRFHLGVISCIIVSVIVRPI